MSQRIAQIALLAVVVWAVLAIWTFSLGAYMISGMSFIFLSFSLYIWETRRQ